MQRLRFGLSKYGLLAVVLVMLPNLVNVVYQPARDPLAMGRGVPILLDILENIGRLGVMVTLLGLAGSPERPRHAGLARAIAILCIAAYYILWTCYFLNVSSRLTLLGLAVFPSVYFCCVAYVLRNPPGLVFSALFGVMHIVVTAGNYL